MDFEDYLVARIHELMRGRFGGSDAVALKRLFDAYDTNGDGQIDRDELARLLADAGVGNELTRKAWVRAAMRQLDTDGSQTISYRELETIVEQPP